MSKRRVHELAKELGMDNREAVAALQAAGVSVKTHSSSVYEEEAKAVLGKVAPPPPPPPPARRPGMMIVKKRRDGEGDAAEGEAAAATPVAPLESATSEQAPAGTQPAAAEAPPALAEDSAADTRPSSAGDELAAAPTSGDEEPAPEAAPAAGDPPAAAPAARPAAPGSATVVRMIDRDKLMERVPNRRLGAGDGRRGPPPGPGRPAAGGPGGGQRFGQVTELRVVTDPYGRGREMVQVGRDRKKGTTPGAPGAGRPAPGGRRGRVPGRRDMNDMRERSMHPSRLRKKKAGKRTPGKSSSAQPRASKRVIRMKESIVVADLAHQLGTKAVDIIRRLMAMGTMVTQNQAVDFATAQVIAEEHSFTVESVAFAESQHIEDEADGEADGDPRPPVVTVMGHVDHGKTSLLDAIRKARVARGEAGGITQHIGAYQVAVPGRGSVTFLDTPGHAAFTAMRARGAQVTDIVVLVVAADDGLMPQTEEAIRHAQAAEVPIVVAINKIDRPEAQPDRVMQELTKFNLVCEAWGGDTLMVQTSATEGTGIPELLETVLLQAEVLELTAHADRRAQGTVVEAQLDRGRGPIATVLVQEGTLSRGDAVVVGTCHGKVRALVDDQGRSIKSAGPSQPVEIAGLDQVPAAGDRLNVVESADAAREVAEHRLQARRGREATAAPINLDDLMRRMQGTTAPELKLVLKADVQGSVEAVREALSKLSLDEARVNVIYGGVGAIKESDITLAAASGGMVLGFGVRPDGNARGIAEREGVEIRTYKVIYEAIDDVRRAMEGLLSPTAQEKVVGRAEVREVFRVSKVGVIAGCRVVDGKASRGAKVRVLRDSVQVYDGKVGSLRRFKDDAREVDTGLECGIGVESYNDIKVADVIEFYQVEEVARTFERAQAERRRAPAGAPAAQVH